MNRELTPLDPLLNPKLVGVNMLQTSIALSVHNTDCSLGIYVHGDLEVVPKVSSYVAEANGLAAPLVACIKLSPTGR